MHQGRIGSRLRGQWFHMVMGLLVILQTPILAVVELFLPKNKRGDLWRTMGAFACRAAFFLSGIRMKVVNPEHINRIGPAIYAGNHGCPLDGFILSSILGKNALLFTAPLPVFPKPVAYWMRKMEVIDVRRDSIDDAKYPQGESKEQAFARAKKELARGKSLIIFPEGHIQYLGVVHYFHTGATRISAATKVPVVPVAMTNTYELIPDKNHVHAGMITVHFGAPFPPPKNNQVKTICAARDMLEKRVTGMLPPHYLPHYYFDNDPHKIGVFIDIDNTLYDGITLVDLFRYLRELHQLQRRDIIRACYWLFLEHMHEIPHKEFMKRELLALRGWDATALEKLTRKLFKKKMLKKFNYHLYTLLKDHVEAGHALIFVTETIHPIARAFSEFLQARTTLDTTLETEVFHHHKRYTGNIACLCYKEKKAELVLQFARGAHIDLSKSYGYGDSINDAPFLRLLGHPVAANPDRELLSFAHHHRWPVLKED